MAAKAERSPGSGADGVIEVLRHAGRQMETAPGVFESQNEEALRTILMIAVNGATRGSAVAEAFNRRGKTDILVRAEGVNCFLAECKIYGGPKGLGEAITQLLGYTGWRERQVGLIVFVRSTAMSTAIRATRKALSEEASVRAVRDLDPNGSELRATVTHPADPDIDLEITVQLFHLPIPRDRDELVGGVVSDQGESLAQLLSARGVPAATEGIAYQRHEDREEADLPSHPDALIRVERITPEGRVAIDAVPLEESAAREHAPAGRIELPDSEDARGQLRRALRDNVAIDVPGARVRFDRLPPLFRDAADEIAAADPEHITVRVSPRGLWQCRMHVDTNRGKLTVPMAFAGIETENDDELAVRGSFHELWLTLRMKRGGEPNLEWAHRPTDAPIRERLASLDFLYALSGEGEVRWESLDPPGAGTLAVTTEQDELPEDLAFDREFLENVTLIEDYLQVGFELPDEIHHDEVAAIFTAAKTVRTGSATVRVDNLTFKADHDVLAEGDETEIRGPVPVDILILGTPFRLGLGHGSLLSRVTRVEPQGEIDHVTVVPRDEAAATIEVSDIRPVPGQEKAES